ncbi:MAG: MmcQ/YjbR family DNA-binding protein [Leptospiraceae bacterium]|nr:MmcQ/YjbR family DNA-binding protein [Leptospiraceae bacterium]MCB1319652.1 MmcQ/YjbR family DNA-binding protein [Leptospiraceae bacterium]
MATDAYSALKEHFQNVKDVDLPGSKGAQGLKYKGKMFAMFYKGDLSVKLPPERVAELIKTGKGSAHDPGTGKPMKDRLLIPASQKRIWIKMCAESLAYVKG